MSRSIALNIAIIGIIYLILSYLFKRNETFTEGMAPIPKSVSLIENLSTPILSPIIFSTPVVTTGTFTVTWSGGTAPGVTTLYDAFSNQMSDSAGFKDGLGNVGGSNSRGRGVYGTTSTTLIVTNGALWPGVIHTITVTARSQATSLYNAATTTNTINVNPTPVNSTPPPPQNPTLVNPTPPPPPNPTLAQPQPLITGPVLNTNLVVWINSDNVVKNSNNVITAVPNNASNSYTINVNNSPTITTNGILLGSNSFSNIPSLSTNYTFDGNETICVVMQILPNSGYPIILSGPFSNGTYSNSSRILTCQANNSNMNYYINFKYNVSNYGMITGPYNGQTGIGTISSPQTNSLIVTTMGSSNQFYFSYSNGVGGSQYGFAGNINSQPHVNGGIAKIVPVQNEIGSVIGGGSQIYLREILIYNSILSSTDRQMVEGYLAKKWNINLPNTHPHFITSQPTTLGTQPNTTLATITGNVFVLPGDNFDQTIQTNGYSGRYIRVRPPQSTGDGYLNLSQIIVKNAAGTNIALNKPVYVTTSHPSGASGSILVDGNTTKRFWPNIWHSDKGDRSDFVEIDLGSSMAISSVQIIARDEFPNRVRNIRIEINTTTNIVPTLYTTVPQPPQPPTNITATNITVNSARISWTNTNSKVQYTVSTTPSTTATPIIIGLSSVDLTGLLPNTMYYFNASSINTSGQISTAPLFNFTTLPPPPENIIATNITSISARISWTKKTDNQVQYTISATPSTTNTPIKIGLSHISYVDLTGFLPNTTYYFNISTLSTLGLISKAPLFTFTTLATPPTNITATNITITSATISWTNTNSKVQYTVSTTPSTTTTPIIIGLSSVNLTGLLANTTYFFKVDSINTSGQKSNTPLFSFNTSSLPRRNWALRPINPYNISITGLTKNTCTVQWTDSNNVISYYYTLSPVPSSTQPNLGKTKSVNYTNLLPNTTYTFSITSIYSVGSTPPITKTFKTLP
jgi:hypothetical protein